ncbi:ABC transporter permease [Microvirga sp. 17 mud 1-3]|uniref:ABC transporter permease n=1 Tax=Microvirga sp. 17 mud 1-3 TaxID=2082949 RepID=UPI000D6C2B55|nr:ABC transporter permease [Microvirga sp. 17 mud 1-3]AWM88932.1 ABC transporter permease [Microvirga sp. 17 mud 1-3]
MALALLWLPFVTYRANRIVSGEPRLLLQALPLAVAMAVAGILVIVACIAVLGRRPWVRLAAAVIGLVVVVPAVGLSAGYVTPPENDFARVSPASGFWLLVLSLGLLIADSLTRLRFGPWARLGALAIAAGAVALLLVSGAWHDLSLLKEYATRADSFWREAERHVFLALGSVAAAVAIGLPVGVLCHRRPALRGPLLQGLNIVQTIPSIALFGMLMVPLGFLAAQVPLAAALGIRGIGAAPAALALFLYALLPIVANTVIGLDQVPATVVDAARGMGMSRRQRLMQVKLPLALPIILTGIRIVLVQNLGLATIAALIGGGGLGTFVFQGVGQTAMDLVLLGAIPTVALSFAAAVILDAIIDLTGRTRS